MTNDVKPKWVNGEMVFGLPDETTLLLIERVTFEKLNRVQSDEQAWIHYREHARLHGLDFAISEADTWLMKLHDEKALLIKSLHWIRWLRAAKSERSNDVN